MSLSVPSVAGGGVPDQRQFSAALAGLSLPTFASGSGGPWIVAVEGPNGAGKSTLCGALARNLNAPACLGTDAAWFSEAFKTRMIRDAEWFSSAMFFMSGCFEQMRLLRNRCDRLIILDRSLWSTLAVHAAEGSERLAALVAMLGPIASQIRVPDFTLVLRASFETCQSRIALKSGAARALDELTANPAFHAREQEFYAWLERQRKDVAFLDVDRPDADAVARQAEDLIRGRIKC
jgi:thymidylate kinase